jgi:GT2 family glycosyltransferase
MFDITCSIVVYHSPLADLQNSINSFLNHSGHIRLFIVDNSGNDNLRFSLQHPRIEYIFPGKNLGYGKAHNLAIQKIRGKSKYHLVLNPDVEFDPSILDSLFQFMEQRSYIGLVMPKVLYRNGEMQHLCKMLPSPFDLFLRRFLPGPLKRVFKHRLDHYELKHVDYNKTMQIPNLSGCFMFLRTEALEQVGPFDDRYFMYMEDTDLCRRINVYYQTIYYPVVSIVHGYSKASYKSLRLLRHHLSSSVRYFNKWGWFVDPHRSLINNSVMTYRYLPKLSLDNKIPASKRSTQGAVVRAIESQRMAKTV